MLSGQSSTLCIARAEVRSSRLYIDGAGRRVAQCKLKDFGQRNKRYTEMNDVNNDENRNNNNNQTPN